MQCKEGKNVANERIGRIISLVLWVISPSTSKSIFPVASQFQHPVSPPGDDLPLVDLHLNISKFFDGALLRAHSSRRAPNTLILSF